MSDWQSDAMKKPIKIGIFSGAVAIIGIATWYFPLTSEFNSGDLASEYCLENGGLPVLITTQNEFGTIKKAHFCEFKDGSQCEVWEYFNGECRPDG